ncbi:MAG: hypothetical protein ABR583_11190 [Gaiellaceae bacterium]
MLRAFATYHFVHTDGRAAQFGFLGSVAGTPTVQDPVEIDELGWFDPRALPRPLTNFARVGIPDALAGSFGDSRRIEVQWDLRPPRFSVASATTSGHTKRDGAYSAQTRDTFVRYRGSDPTQAAGRGDLWHDVDHARTAS